LGRNRTFARIVNNRGQILGSTGGLSGIEWFLNGSTVTQFFGTFTWSSFVRDLNNNGSLLGYSSREGHYYLLDGNSLSTATPSFLLNTVLSDGLTTMNDGGLIAGANGTNLNLFDLSFGLNGPVLSLGTLGDGIKNASDINNSGVVVGDFRYNSSDEHAFVYNGQSLLDLNSVISPTLGWTLETANAINDNGQIVGGGLTPTGEHHAYRLSPVPVPESEAVGLSASAVCVLLLALRAYRNNREIPKLSKG